MTNIRSAAYNRDANNVPITVDGPITSKEITFSGSNATVNVPLFHITGAVEVLRLWGVVTTVIGVNHTAASWRLNDQTAQIYLTAIGGVDISGNAAGSLLVKNGLKAAAAVELTNAAGVVSEPTTLETLYFSPMVLIKKTAAVTDIEYHYATTDEPTSGSMIFYVSWLPISEDGAIEAI